MTSRLWGDLSHHVNHLHGRQRCFVSFIGVFGSGTLHRLLDVIGGEDSEPDGDSVFLSSFPDASRHRFRNVFEMWRIASNHRPQTNQRVVFPTGCHSFSDQRNFERPWNTDDGKVFLCSPMTLESIERSFKEPFCDELIESAYDDADFQASRIELAFNGYPHIEVLRPNVWLACLRDSIEDDPAYAVSCGDSEYWFPAAVLPAERVPRLSSHNFPDRQSCADYSLISGLFELRDRAAFGRQCRNLSDLL